MQLSNQGLNAKQTNKRTYELNKKKRDCDMILSV